MFQYTAKQRTIRKSEKIKKIWLTGKGARDATASKKKPTRRILMGVNNFVQKVQTNFKLSLFLNLECNIL